MGLERFELSTPRLSSVCSNQLSYRPSYYFSFKEPMSVSQDRTVDRRVSVGIDLRLSVVAPKRWTMSPRKEVIQPQVPLRLPCYDFTPVTSHSLRPPSLRLGKPFLEQLTPMV